MPVGCNKALETFGGPADDDITDPPRTIDGGDCPGLAVGEWDNVDDAPGPDESMSADIARVPVMQGSAVTGTNQATLTAIDIPLGTIEGDELLLCVLSRNAAQRSFDVTSPAGVWFTVVRHSSGSQLELTVMQHTVGAGDPSTYDIDFTGSGGAGCTQIAFIVTLRGQGPFLAVGAIGGTSTWGSQHDLGPVDGLTTTGDASCVFLVAGKQNDFTGKLSAAGWSCVNFQSFMGGDDAGLALFFKVVETSGTVVSAATLIDAGLVTSDGAGAGFMFEMLCPEQVPFALHHRGHDAESFTQDYTSIVCKDIPGVGGPSGSPAYMVEVGFEWFENLFGWVGALLRFDDTVQTGYEITLFPWESNPLTPGSTIYIGRWFNNVFTLLDSVSVPDPAYRLPHKLRAWISGSSPTLTLKIWLDDELEYEDNFIVEDVGEEIPEDGYPGLQMLDNGVAGTGTDGLGMRVTSFRAADTEDCEYPVGPCYPCEGGPENPYPNTPPPSTPQPWGMYKRKNLAWHAVRPEDLSARANLAHRAGSAETKLRANLDWRAIAAELEEWPVPDTDVPPYFDPCQQLTPIPPGDVEPIPLTGRFIGISHAPVSILGPVLNGTRFAAGPWTPADLAACAARGAILTTAPGGRAQYLAPGGYWDLGAFIDGTLARLLPILSVLQDATVAGHYHGHSLIDDFESEKLWPKPPGFVGTWTGVPHGDIATALVIIRSECPGIRLGVRGRPSQFAPANLGFDFYEAAYKAWSGLTPTAFVNLEYTLAMAWGSFIHLSANFLHGGDGSSGIQHNDGTMLSGKYEMSAAEVASYTVEMYDRAEELDNAAILAGTLGYEYTNTYLTRTGMVDAFTIARNRLAALPALP